MSFAHRLTLASAVLGAALLVAPVASADPSGADLLLARNLANDGVALQQKGDCEGALVKLQRAEAIHHAPTILVHVGECQIKLGKLVDALSSLDRVSKESLGPTPPRAFVTAQERATKLVAEIKPKLGTLKIDATGTRTGAIFQLDASDLKEAALGLERPVDPGVHVIEATSANGVRVRKEVKVGEGGNETVVLALPIIKDPPPAVAFGPQPTEKPRETNKLKPLGIGLVAGGGAALVASGVFAIVTLSKKSDLDASCADKTCPPSSQDSYDSAKTTATISGIALGVGVVAVAAGVYVLVFHRDKEQAAATALASGGTFTF